MFQSSRIASGNCLRQASSACSPSSASTIWNSSPSRMRRATLRMTLESSTTKQVFIVSLFVFAPEFHSRFLRTASCCGRLLHDVEHTINIEHHQQLPIESVDAGRYARQARIEI